MYDVDVLSDLEEAHSSCIVYDVDVLSDLEEAHSQFVYCV